MHVANFCSKHGGRWAAQKETQANYALGGCLKIRLLRCRGMGCRSARPDRPATTDLSGLSQCGNHALRRKLTNLNATGVPPGTYLACEKSYEIAATFMQMLQLHNSGLKARSERLPVGWCPIPPYRIATHLAARVNHRAMERHVRTIVVSGSRGVGIWIRIALPLLRCG
jgi:hypothetical protein